ncbi:hypothetical protein [Streptomyces sp. NBC_00019]|uniref:hypothetical protein n=1 Tax=Streptomyces sp. NBC_00019 TaxID=2975623 RepID=UPI0038660B2D
MRFPVRTGVPWRDIPVEYGPWNRVYDLPPLAAERNLAAAPHPAPVPGRRDGRDCLGPEGRVTCRRNHRAASSPSPTILGWDGREIPWPKPAPRNGASRAGRSRRAEPRAGRRVDAGADETDRDPSSRHRARRHGRVDAGKP